MLGAQNAYLASPESPSITEQNQAIEMTEKTDILLVTVNKHETDAVIAAFAQATGTKAQSFSAGERLYYKLGSINGANCVLTISEMGSGGPGATHQTVNDALATVDPTYVIAVGIAFGVNEKKQKIGDILVSKHLWLYELQKKKSGGTVIPRGDKTHASTQLVNLFRSCAQVSWEGASVDVGTLMTGEKLIDDVDYRDELIRLEGEALGGEMEGAGVYVPCLAKKKDWIVVKAICDWADGKKSTNKTTRQKKAAKNAAEFVVHCLKQGKLSVSKPKNGQKAKEKNTVVVDFAKPDAAPAVWLSEKLRLAGFNVWNRITAPVAGETSDDVYKKLVKEEASHVIMCMSNTGLNNEAFKERRVYATACGVTIIPIELDTFDDRKIEKSIRSIDRISCTSGWGSGYTTLLKLMAETDGLPSNGTISGLFLADVPLIERKPEKLASNQYRITQLPGHFKRFKVKESLTVAEKATLFEQWPATEYSNNYFISFFVPSAKVKSEFGLSAAQTVPNLESSFKDERVYRNTLIELCKKSFYHHCKNKGLSYCSVNEMVYFPQGHSKIKVRTLAGKNSNFSPTGERTYRKKDVFRYQMAPIADIQWNKAGMWILVRIYIRLTDKSGVLLKSRSIPSRRTTVCKNWWNDEWLKRTMGVMQFLSKDGQTIVIGGAQTDAIKVNALPDTLEIPVSLKEEYISKNKDEDRDELLSERDSDNESGWDSEDDDDDD